ncbi:hypothetical protein [Acidithiobacillus ferrivorans]|uniref:Uncharacterized protein n=1 Tax=Acidithiobacillus ferrivorans TaxID=160808 RepID=A0A7T4WCA0_9PROT|nr:hypothetical protein [Acidithiobacillus ferrivorans]QQD71983.1 hypothetical protein H2515_11170 [Acidithiobacillus ferrivorans]
MSEVKRKMYTSIYKAMVGLEAITGAKTIEDLAHEHGVNPTQVRRWKMAIENRASMLFNSKRERQPDVERTSKRMARQSRLAKGVHLQRHQWESLFIAAVVQHQLPGQVSGLLYVIYQECVQSVQIIEGAPKLLWVFDRPIRDLAADGMPDGKQRAAKHLSACLGRLESYELIRRLESRKGRPVVFEVLISPSEADL